MHDWHKDLDLNLREISDCSSKEKNNLVDLTATIVGLATVARSESMLAIERHRNNIEDPYLAHLLELLVDGNGPAFISSCARNFLIFSGAKGYQLRRLLIIGSGIAAIAQDIAPRTILTGLLPYIGLEHIAAMKDAGEGHVVIADKALKAFVESSRSRTARSEKTALLERIVPLLPAAIKEYLLKATPMDIYVQALTGASGKVAGLLLEPAPLTLRETFETTIANNFWRGSRTENTTAEYQLRILESLNQAMSEPHLKGAFDDRLKKFIKAAVKSKGKTEIQHYLRKRPLDDKAIIF